MAAESRPSTLQVQSPFVYHDNCNKQVAKTIAETNPAKALKTLSKVEVIYLYDTNYFTDSDLQLVRIIAKNVFCTVPMLERSLNQYLNTRSSKDTVAVLSNLDNSKGRLNNLVKAHVLTKYLFDVPVLSPDGESTKRTMSYFLVTPHGYNFIKRILNYNGNYDEYLSVTPIEEVFKYLSTVSICQSFFNVDGFIDYTIDVPFYIKSDRKLIKLYGEIVKKKNGVNHSILIEPVKFKFNKNRISENEWISAINDRFELIKNYINNKFLSIGDNEFSLIIPCEDVPGIQNACVLAKNYLPEYLPYIYFTIDAAVNKNGFENTFIQLKDNGDMIFVTPRFI